MDFSLIKKKGNVRTIVFSIDTGGVSATVFEKKLERSSIIWHEHFPIAITETPTYGVILDKTKEALTHLAQTLSKHHKLYTPKCEVSILLGSPWHISYEEKIIVNNDKAEKVTDRLIENAIEDSFGTMHPDLVITGKNILSYSSNGYEKVSIVGKVIKDFEISVYVESVQATFKQMTEDIISKYFPHSVVSYTTASFVAAEALKKLYNIKDFLLLIPSYENTELILINNNIINALATLPFGTATIGRKLFKANSSHIFEMIQKTKRYITNDFDNNTMQMATTLLNKEKGPFLRMFEDTVWKMSSSFSISPKIIVFGRTIASHILMEWLKDAKLQNNVDFLTTTDDKNVVNINGKDILDISVENKGTEKLGIGGILSSFYINYLKQ